MSREKIEDKDGEEGIQMDQVRLKQPKYDGSNLNLSRFE